MADGVIGECARRPCVLYRQRVFTSMLALAGAGLGGGPRLVLRAHTQTFEGKL